MRHRRVALRGTAQLAQTPLQIKCNAAGVEGAKPWLGLRRSLAYHGGSQLGGHVNKVIGVLGAVLLSAGIASAGCQSDEKILETMLRERQRLIEAGELEGEAREKYDAMIEAHAGAKDAVFSGLYWYRDLDEAKATARRTGKPILSLRLLGELTCDLSCANSRFFRTVLYANQELSAWLRENVVLHWQSVRPVPVITIDFGDGRVLKRTVTGNSIHYVLTPDGQVVDALPGLYGPRRFRQQLELAVAALGKPETSVSRSGRLAEHARERLAALELGRLRAEVRARPPARSGHPSAAEAAPVAMGKAMVEAPLVRASTGEDPARLGSLSLGPVTLDAGSLALMRTKLSPERAEGEAFAAIVARFEDVIAKDMAHNELNLRPRILRKLIAGGAVDVEALNAWVYAELFKTPHDDPWLGLDSGAYAALDVLSE